MAQPTRYTPTYNFTNWQSTHPSDPLPGDEVDAQFAALQVTTDGICNNLALIQRDDGALKNLVVTPESLSTEVVNMLAGYTPRGAWVTATAYVVGDIVSASGGTYVCVVAHTSGTFATDLAAVKWILIASTGASTAASFTPTGSTPPTDGMYLPAANTVGFASNSLSTLRLVAVASAQNYLQISASASSNPVILSAQGAGSNVDITLTPKGSGTVNMPSLALTTALPLTSGGTSATTASGARTALGATTVGTNVFTAADAAAGRSAISAEQVASGLAAVTPALDDFAVITDTSDTNLSKRAALSLIGAAIAKINDFRLTLTTGVPVTTSDVTGATTLYCTPCVGNSIALYDGTNWNLRNSAQFSLALGTLSNNTNYDVFCYDNAGVPTLEFTAWSGDTTRATALAYQDGVLVKSGTATRRYLGSFRTTATTTTEDSKAKRYLWNYYNRRRRVMERIDSTASWTYTTQTFRQARASTDNQLNFLVGVAEDNVEARLLATWDNSAGTFTTSCIALDSTSTRGGLNGTSTNSGGSGYECNLAHYDGVPAAGYHYLAWLEWSVASGTTTWYGTSTNFVSGLYGSIMA